jgi:hypothetical protein
MKELAGAVGDKELQRWVEVVRGIYEATRTFLNPRTLRALVWFTRFKAFRHSRKLEDLLCLLMRDFPLSNRLYVSKGYVFLPEEASYTTLKEPYPLLPALREAGRGRRKTSASRRAKGEG